MVFPSGEQFRISAGDHVAVVTESGAALRLLQHRGRDLVHPFAEDRMSSGGRGQLLVPWPNRIRDGRYSFGGRDLQLGLTDPGHGNASHGLARWAAWTLEEHTDTSVSLVYRVMAQTGYPWALDLHVLYDLSADGLVVTQTATNLSPEPAPYASGAHPYLCVGDTIEDLELHLPVRTRVLLDDRRLPTGRSEPVSGAYDFTSPRRVGDVVLDDAFGDLEHAGGRATATLRDPGSGHGVQLWVDERHRWLQVYTPPADGPRPAVAVEPMTAPVDAFNSGTDVVVLSPAGQDGDEVSASWGLRAL